MAELYHKHLFRSVIVVIFLSHMALVSTSTYTVGFLIFPLLATILYPVSQYLLAHSSLYTKCTTIINVAFLVFIPVYILSNELVGGVILLFTYVQLYSLLNWVESKNILHLLMMSLFILITTLVLSPSVVFSVIFVLFIYFSVSSLLLLDRAHHADSSILLTLPDAHRDRGGKMTASRSSYSRLRYRVLGLSMCVLIATGFLFVFFPRTEAGIFGADAKAKQAQVGLSERTSFDLVGRISGTNDIVMKVHFTDFSDGVYDEEKYWRVKTLGKYSPEGWSRQDLATIPYNYRLPREPSQGKTNRSNNRNILLRGFRNGFQFGGSKRPSITRKTLRASETVNYEVVFTDASLTPAPFLNTVVSVQNYEGKFVVLSSWDPAGDFSVNVKTRSIYNGTLHVTSQVVLATPDELRNSSDDYMDVMLPSDYRLLTEHNLQPRTLELVRQLTEGKETKYDQVQALAEYLTSDQFLYSTYVPKLDATHPLDNFIHDIRHGHCELYAGAMAVMVRSLGIPARTVQGYRGGQWNALDSSYAVTENMTHLWVEVYFPDYGWITFDPTPAVDTSGMTRIEEIQAYIEMSITRIRFAWLTNVIAFKPLINFNLFEGQTFNFFGTWLSSVLQGSGAGSFSGMEHLKGSLLLASPLLCMYYGVTHRRKRKTKLQRYMLNAEQQKARELYIRLIQRLSKLGVDVGNISAEELLEELASVECLGLAEVESIAAFIARYHDTRFGGQSFGLNELNEYSAMIRGLRNQPIAG